MYDLLNSRNSLKTYITVCKPFRQILLTAEVKLTKLHTTELYSDEQTSIRKASFTTFRLYSEYTSVCDHYVEFAQKTNSYVLVYFNVPFTAIEIYALWLNCLIERKSANYWEVIEGLVDVLTLFCWNVLFSTIESLSLSAMIFDFLSHCMIIYLHRYLTHESLTKRFRTVSISTSIQIKFRKYTGVFSLPRHLSGQHTLLLTFMSLRNNVPGLKTQHQNWVVRLSTDSSTAYDV